MSIDPIKNHFPLGSQRERQPAEPAGQGGATPFAQVLQTTQKGPETNQAVKAQAEMMFRRAQLQLLQGLFAEDEKNGSQTELIDLLAVERPPVSRQQVDKLYTQLQPSLLEPERTSRQQIDRLIEQVAAEVSLAPELIHSVVAAESSYDPAAVSTAGAQGLMQLMPQTASELGVGDSFDPQQNLLGGSRYLKQLLDKYDGDLDRALAAYNWGQGNVDRKGLEQMPEETRNYLARVKGALAQRG